MWIWMVYSEGQGCHQSCMPQTIYIKEVFVQLWTVDKCISNLFLVVLMTDDWLVCMCWGVTWTIKHGMCTAKTVSSAFNSVAALLPHMTCISASLLGWPHIISASLLVWHVLQHHVVMEQGWTEVWIFHHCFIKLLQSLCMLVCMMKEHWTLGQALHRFCYCCALQCFNRWSSN